MEELGRGKYDQNALYKSLKKQEYFEINIYILKVLVVMTGLGIRVLLDSDRQREGNSAKQHTRPGQSPSVNNATITEKPWTR